MLESFLMSFIFVGGLSFLIWFFSYSLTHNSIKEPWKGNKWFTVGEYRSLSTEDKLKYHKYKGDIVEKLDLKYPLSTLVKIKYRDLETLYKIKKEDGKDFFLDKYSKLSLENPEYETFGLTRICNKLNDGKIMELYTNDHWGQHVSIKIDNFKDIGYVSDYDNIIIWENLTYRDEIIQAFKKLDITLEKALC